MCMVYWESHFPKLKAKGFEFFESCNAGIYNGLPSEALISAFRQDLQSEPVISGIGFSSHDTHLTKVFIAKAKKKFLQEVNRICSTGYL